jgi:hypothetical protein
MGSTRLAELVRQAGSYRWVGLYEVTEQEVAAIGWSWVGAPAYPRFPVAQPHDRHARFIRLG